MTDEALRALRPCKQLSSIDLSFCDLREKPLHAYASSLAFGRKWAGKRAIERVPPCVPAAVHSAHLEVTRRCEEAIF